MLGTTVDATLIKLVTLTILYCSLEDSHLWSWSLPLFEYSSKLKCLYLTVNIFSLKPPVNGFSLDLNIRTAISGRKLADSLTIGYIKYTKTLFDRKMIHYNGWLIYRLSSTVCGWCITRNNDIPPNISICIKKGSMIKAE